MPVDIFPLDEATLQTHMPAILAIAADVPLEYWEASHFLAPRPEKWQLSHAAWQAGEPVGYVIASRTAPETAHVHHFMVAANWRRAGIGKHLLSGVQDVARALGARAVTLKVHESNISAQQAYRAMNFTGVSTSSGYLLMQKEIV